MSKRAVPGTQNGLKGRGPLTVAKQKKFEGGGKKISRKRAKKKGGRPTVDNPHIRGRTHPDNEKGQKLRKAKPPHTPPFPTLRQR